MRVSQPSGPRRMAKVTEETRTLILEAAEAEFAARGFSAARLSDVAGRVGISRAAVLYHFRDKQALYDAVLEAAFEPLSARIREALALPGPSAERIERVLGAWFDYAVERPALGRLFLREVAEAEGALRPELDRLAAPLFAAFLETIEHGQRAGEFRAIDASHVANILSGATIWLLTGAQMLGGNEEPRERRLAQHRDELVEVARHLLGVGTAGAGGSRG